MKELFGIPTTNIAIVLVALFALSVATVLATAIFNRTMFRMGVRNLPRRGAQTGLIVVGLMLSTLIVTAAFVTGDTIDYSLTNNSYEVFGRTDLDIGINDRGDVGADYGAATAGAQTFVPETTVDVLEAQFGLTGSNPHDPDIAAFLPFLQEQAPAENQRAGTAVPAVQLSGFDPARMASVGGFRLVNGGTADLANAQPNDAFVSKRAQEALDLKTGDIVTVYIAGVPKDLRVAAIVEDELANGVLGAEYSSVPGGIALPIDTLQTWTNHDGKINVLTVALEGGVRDTLDKADGAAARIEAYLATPEGHSAFDIGDREIPVTTVKKDSVELGEENGNLFTTFFLVLGMFSMASGVMLIFMIFVMLAAERRGEMGMARAVGAQRKHLLQSFLSEGMTYSVLSGVIGAGLGVLASVGMTAGLLKLVGGDYFSLVHVHFTATSLVIGYTLGVVITFITVLFAALKVSRVNIVAAIRNLPDEGGREARRKTRWRWVIASVPFMVVPPLGLWFLLRKGLGLPWAWIVGPSGIVLGGLFMMLGSNEEVLFPFALGISLLPLSVASIARFYRAPARPTWTIVGVLLAAYWLMPSSTHDRLFGKFDSDIEMFVLSGIMVVVSFTLIIIFNARLLTTLFSRGKGGVAAYRTTVAVLALAVASVAAGVALGDSNDGLGELAYLLAGLLVPVAGLAFAAARFPGLGPSLKMAIAYPLSNRFRTGMTIAMFSLIVFSLTVFSILMANFSDIEGGASARGNIDVMATTSLTNPIGDLRYELEKDGSTALQDVTAIGRTTLPTGSQQVRQVNAGDGEWTGFPVIAGDDDFFARLQPTLEERANGYADDAAVLEAVRTTPGLALMDKNALRLGFGAYDFYVDDVAFDDDNRFEPFEVEVRNPITGESQTLTVVGGLKVNLSQELVGGLFVSEGTYAPTFGTPVYQRYYLHLPEKADSKAVAKSIESALAVRGVDAESVQQLLDNASGQQKAFQRMFQAFMALGLIVGIAGLGVIAFRSVVERRQQIGMLRAIGFQRGTVALAFLLESSFIAVMGIASGVVGGAIIARNLLTSPDFTEGASVNFALPWAEIVGMVVTAYLFSLLMTWWPSRGAARVPVADALRYE